MRSIGIQINGISVANEHGHYLLEKENKQMRCDYNELNESIPEFEEILKQVETRLQTA